MNIQVSNITKQYKEKVALQNLNFTLEGPKIVGFLGHNGAGKTTFLNILSGLIVPTAGEMKVNGEPVFNNTPILQDICFVAESGNFQLEMTVGQAIKANQYFYPEWDQALAEKLVKVFGLSLKMKVKNLSKGMLSALGIIVGLASNAKITIFDEPYIGLDVAARSMFYDLLLEQQEVNPRLFILSTHLIDEISNLLDEVMIVQDGALMLQVDCMDWDETIMAIRGFEKDVAEVVGQHTVLYEHTFLKEKTVVLHLKDSLRVSETVKVERVSIHDALVYLSKQRREGLAL